MKCVEIISVRTSGNFDQETFAYLRSLCQEATENPFLSANLYRNSSYSGDLAVILSRQTEQSNEDKSRLGLTLADTLKRYGLVDHTCWVMDEN